MRKSRYKIEIVAMAITYYWVLFAPNGEPIAESYSHYSSPSNAKRAARNADDLHEVARRLDELNRKG